MILLAEFLFRAYGFLIMVRVLMSWFQPDPLNPLVKFVIGATEPALGPCRELLNSLLSALGVDVRTMPMDFSPILAYLILDWLIRPAVINLLIMIMM